jgi:hypothetical protein
MSFTFRCGHNCDNNINNDHNICQQCWMAVCLVCYPGLEFDICPHTKTKKGGALCNDLSDI